MHIMMIIKYNKYKHYKPEKICHDYGNSYLKYLEIFSGSLAVNI